MDALRAAAELEAAGKVPREGGWPTNPRFLFGGLGIRFFFCIDR